MRIKDKANGVDYSTKMSCFSDNAKTLGVVSILL